MDRDELKRIDQEIMHFNKTQPENAIKGSTIISGRKARQRYSKHAIHGLSLRKKQSHLYREKSFTTEQEIEE
jgi:hypothetical protein